MTHSKDVLKANLERWAKVYNTNSKLDQQLYYDVQISCISFGIDFDEVLNFMDGKRSKFKMKQLK